MNFLKNSIKIGALLLFGTIYAQQQPNYALYRYTMNAINPAYAGADGVSRLTANFRSQWVSVEDAPETQTLFFETSLNDNVGLGLSIVNDDVFANENTTFVVDFSYKLKFNESFEVIKGICFSLILSMSVFTLSISPLSNKLNICVRSFD